MARACVQAADVGVPLNPREPASAEEGSAVEKAAEREFLRQLPSQGESGEADLQSSRAAEQVPRSGFRSSSYGNPLAPAHSCQDRNALIRIIPVLPSGIPWSIPCS
jgi:hypothetical protein